MVKAWFRMFCRTILEENKRDVGATDPVARHRTGNNAKRMKLREREDRSS